MADSAKGRVERLLEELKVPDDFRDENLPVGVFSHSQYSAFRICGRAYEFRYLLRAPSPPSPEMVRGSAVHKAVEAALKAKMSGRNISLGALQDLIVREFDARAIEVQDWGERNPDELRMQALQLHAAFYLNALPSIHPVAVEKGWAARFGGVPMVGWIDLIEEQPAMDVSRLTPRAAALSPKKRVVVDTKTSEKRWSADNVRKNPQLTLYSAVERTPFVRVDQLVPYQRGAAYVPSGSERTATDIAVLEEDVAEVAGLIERGIFPMTTIDSWTCNAHRCAYWTLCRGRKRNPNGKKERSRVHQARA